MRPLARPRAQRSDVREQTWRAKAPHGRNGTDGLDGRAHFCTSERASTAPTAKRGVLPRSFPPRRSGPAQAGGEGLEQRPASARCAALAHPVELRRRRRLAICHRRFDAAEAPTTARLGLAAPKVLRHRRHDVEDTTAAVATGVAYPGHRSRQRTGSLQFDGQRRGQRHDRGSPLGERSRDRDAQGLHRADGLRPGLSDDRRQFVRAGRGGRLVRQ